LLAYSARNLGMHFLNKGELDRARPLLKQVVDIRAELKGKDNIQYADALNDLAVLCTKARQFQAAADIDAQVLQIVRKISGESSADYATILNNSAVTQQHLGNLREAQRLSREALTIMQGLYGPDHRDCAVQYLGLGQVDCALGDFADAETSLKRA